jgi:GDP-4-dehydro-6-deoxy-D-mannose reductase
LERADLITAVNIGSTSNICRSLQNQAHSSILLFISTGLVYQPIDHEDFLGFDESSPVGPVNDYGWSKLAAEAIARIYNGSRIKVYIARPFNHIGPGQDLRFVTPSLAKRILEAHDHTQIQVGNLEAKRDFTDVRDIVRAYRLILELQPEPRTLVLGSGQARPVSDIFKFFLEYSGKHLKHKCTEDLLRREQSIVFGNAALARRVLGWFPEISLQQTLQEVYESIAKGLSTHN